MGRKRYENYDGFSTQKTFKDMRQWSKERRAKKKDLTVQIPSADKIEADRIRQNRSELSITWVGHSTFLIQVDGLNILTDPVWAKWMGIQKRLTEPGLTLEQLPEIDIVLISHGHYDHLDFSTIRRLEGDITFYVPVGLKGTFLKRGYKNVLEANWWEAFIHNELTLTFVPAQHWTKRTLTDTNTSHWGGWIIHSTHSNCHVYFVGDTGYFRGFEEIGEKFDIDIVLMPIGAYEPEWFMKDSHINPEDAIKGFLEMNAKLFVPMHYGAYRLADDTGPEALSRLMNEWNSLQLPMEKLACLKIGETLWL